MDGPKKKAMMMAQVFVYSLSLIIVSLILIYGYSVITKFIGDSSQVECLQFRKALEGYVKEYSTEYGSIGYKKIQLPAGVTEVCFTDYNSKEDNLMACDESNKIYPVVKDSYQTQPKRERKNFFLFGKTNSCQDSYYVGNVTLTSYLDGGLKCNYLCLQSSQGAFKIKITGKGDHVLIGKSAK